MDKTREEGLFHLASDLKKKKDATSPSASHSLAMVKARADFPTPAEPDSQHIGALLAFLHL